MTICNEDNQMTVGHTEITEITENYDRGTTEGSRNGINPPFGDYREPTHRAERKNWKKSWRLFGIYVT